MSFLSSLFGASTPAAATPAPAAPTVSSGQVAAVDREFEARQRKKAGFDQSILTSNLGTTGTSANSGTSGKGATNLQRTTLLGGSSTVGTGY